VLSGLGSKGSPEEELFADEVEKVAGDAQPRGFVAALSSDGDMDGIDKDIFGWSGLNDEVFGDAQVVRSEPDHAFEPVTFTVFGPETAHLDAVS